MSYIFNAHTTSLTVNKHWATSLSVKSQTQIEFLINRDLFDNVDAVARETWVSWLFGYQCLATHLFCYLL